MSWNSLSPELRLTILGCVGGPDPNFARHSPRGYAADNTYAWAPYAAVSREWQVFFERRTFAVLLLHTDKSDVESFSDAVVRCPNRLTYIGRLRLIIDLPEYSKQESTTEEDAAITERHNALFTQNLWRLLRALSTWKEPGPTEIQPWMRDDDMFRAGTLNSAIGIQLELGIHCISDMKYYNHRLPLPGRPIRLANKAQIFQDMGVFHDGGLASWDRFFKSLFARPPVFRRALGRRLLVLGKDPDDRRRRRHRHTLPVATVVRKLVLSRRFFRGIHPATLARLLNVGFPRVQSAHLEPWRPVMEVNRNTLMRGYDTLLKRLAPSLDRLSIFVESDCIVHTHERYPGWKSTARDLAWKGNTQDLALLHQARRPPPCLGLRVAVASCRLAVLNVAFLVDADDVLAAIAHMPASTTWPRLRRLVLTSSTLSPATAPDAIEQLLRAAAAAVARMPHMRQFELWFAHSRHACVFTVDGGACTPRLRLGATWPDAAAALTEDVLDAWRAVVSTWTHRCLDVTNETLTMDTLVAGSENTKSLDARRLVLNGCNTLAREGVFEMSLQDMQLDARSQRRERRDVARAARAVELAAAALRRWEARLARQWIAEAAEAEEAAEMAAAAADAAKAYRDEARAASMEGDFHGTRESTEAAAHQVDIAGRAADAARRAVNRAGAAEANAAGTVNAEKSASAAEASMDTALWWYDSAAELPQWPPPSSDDSFDEDYVFYEDEDSFDDDAFDSDNNFDNNGDEVADDDNANASL